MKNWLPLLILPLVVVIAFGWWQQRRSPSHAIVNAQPVTAATHSNEPITPLPESSDLDAAKVALGEQLFHDPILSHNNKVSCSSCHSLTTAGVDQLVHSVGIDGQRGSVNAPTVFNSGLNFVQFWDGRAATLEEQVDGPMSSPMEMGSNWDEVLSKLHASSTYVSSFNALYQDGIQRANVRDAIATFERSLITPNSRFDRYLRGEQDVPVGFLIGDIETAQIGFSELAAFGEVITHHTKFFEQDCRLLHCLDDNWRNRNL